MSDIPIQFNCGICAKPLTDRTALLTSCGHFFCASPPAACTRLPPCTKAGKCEQCGKHCDAGTLANRAEKYDNRVRTFVFEDLYVLLRRTADIIKFRDTHHRILSDNAVRMGVTIEKLRHEIIPAQRAKMNPEPSERMRVIEQAQLYRRERDELRREMEYLQRDRKLTRQKLNELQSANDTLRAELCQLRRRLESGVLVAKDLPRDESAIAHAARGSALPVSGTPIGFLSRVTKSRHDRSRHMNSGFFRKAEMTPQHQSYRRDNGTGNKWPYESVSYARQALHHERKKYPAVHPRK